MPSPKTPYANTPPSTNKGIMNQAQRKQLDYLDREAMPTPPPAPAPKPTPVAPRGPRPTPDYAGMEREAERYRNKKR